MPSSAKLEKKAEKLMDNNQFKEAASLFIESAQIDLKKKKREDAAIEFYQAAQCLYQIEEYDKALTNFKFAFDIAEQLGDLYAKCQLLNSIGAVLHRKGDYDKALEYYQEALAISEQLDDLREKATNINDIGFIYHERGDLEKALEYYKMIDDDNERAYKLAQNKLSSPMSQIEIEILKGNNNGDCGKHKLAKETFEKLQAEIDLSKEFFVIFHFR